MSVDWDAVADDKPPDWRKRCKICKHPEAARGLHVLLDKGWEVAAIARKLSDLLDDFSCSGTPIYKHIRENHGPPES